MLVTEQSLQRAFARQQRAKIAAREKRQEWREAQQELEDATRDLVAQGQQLTITHGPARKSAEKAGKRG